jgi:hypothetical protein
MFEQRCSLRNDNNTCFFRTLDPDHMVQSYAVQVRGPFATSLCLKLCCNDHQVRLYVSQGRLEQVTQ